MDGERSNHQRHSSCTAEEELVPLHLPGLGAGAELRASHPDRSTAATTQQGGAADNARDGCCAAGDGAAEGGKGDQQVGPSSSSTSSNRGPLRDVVVDMTATLLSAMCGGGAGGGAPSAQPAQVAPPAGLPPPPRAAQSLHDSADSDDGSGPRICRFCLEEEEDEEGHEQGAVDDVEEGRRLLGGAALSSSSSLARGARQQRQWRWRQALSTLLAQHQHGTDAAAPPPSEAPASPSAAAGDGAAAQQRQQQQQQQRASSNPLIAPCLCTGTAKFVHRDCLQRWRESTPAAFARCTICNYEYRFKGSEFVSVLKSPAAPPVLLLAFILALWVVLGFLPAWRVPDEDAGALRRAGVHLANGAVMAGLAGFGVTLADLFSSRRAVMLLATLSNGHQLSPSVTYAVISLSQLLAVAVLVACLVLSALSSVGVIILAILGYNSLSCGPIFRSFEQACERLVATVDMHTSRMVVEEVQPRRRRQGAGVGGQHDAMAPDPHGEEEASQEEERQRLVRPPDRLAPQPVAVPESPRPPPALAT